MTVRRVNRTPPLSWKQATALFSRWGVELISRRSYWRINGRPVVSVLNLTDFVAHYGFTVFYAMLERARVVITKRSGINPFVIGVINKVDGRNVGLANSLPLDGVTGYALLPDWLGRPIQDYTTLIDSRVQEWYRFQRLVSVPFFPVVAAGWDATVRGARISVLDAQSGFPWTPIVTGVTPELFGRFLDCALEFNARMHPNQNIVFLHAWNEWTEGSVIEPSDRYGCLLLGEIERRSQCMSPVLAK